MTESGPERTTERGDGAGKATVAQRGGRMTLPVTDGDSHRVRVLLPAGFTGRAEIRFQEPWYWRAAEVVSVLTAVWIVVLALRRRRFYT